MSNYAKLKTNLKLAIQRLKLLEKKKTELSLKSRKEIADYIAMNKPDRARIRVEHIIREDNYVEAMELLEMFCDLLLARFGLIEKMKELDPGLDEAIATLIWSAPRVSNDIQEFKIISDILTSKYGKNYAEACKTDKTKNVNEKVKKRLGVEPPARLLVEHYLIEIAKNFNVSYAPDPAVMLGQPPDVGELIDWNEHSNNHNGGAGGFGGGATGGGSGGGAGSYNIGSPTANQGPGSYNVGGPGGFNPGGNGGHNIGFDPLTQHKSADLNYPQKPGPNSKIVGSNSTGSYDITLPVIPPPLPSTFPDTDELDNRKSLPPPYAYPTDQNNNMPFDLSDPVNLKRALNGPVVVSDPNAPLPYKPGMYENPPPPVYQEKRPSQQQQQYIPPPQPSAPTYGKSMKGKSSLEDLPSVPDYTPDDRNRKKDDDDDIGGDSFDDLEKRFNNLKNN